MLSDEDAINDVNPFVSRDFSLPGSVGQMGDFADFSETRKEDGIKPAPKSVFCDYSLCRDEGDACSLSRPLHPRRNIDTGFVDKPTTNKTVRIGVSNKSQFSMIGWVIILIFIFMILFYVRR